MRLGLGRDEAAIKQTLHTLWGEGRGGASVCIACSTVSSTPRSISVLYREGDSQTGYVDYQSATTVRCFSLDPNLRREVLVLF